MKKTFSTLLLFLLVLTGCSLNDTKPSDAVDTFFEMYKSKDDTVISQLIDTIEGEGLLDAQEKKYQHLMEKQYDFLSYDIKSVDENGDDATVTVEITVLNYKGAVLKAEEELQKSPEKFNDESGNFSENKYMDYRIELMENVTDKVSYTLELNLTKDIGMWKVNELNNDDISKIHGLY